VLSNSDYRLAMLCHKWHQWQ